jgi:predicted RNA-binding protein with PUA-like domain
MAKRYWLMKSEPDAFGIADLERVKIEPWTGVRNYQARNFMRDQMQVGDDVLFYHSSCEPPGVAGLARIVRTGVVDDTQFDPRSKYHDPDSPRDEPRWICVDVEFVERFPDVIPLDVLRATPGLEDMVLLRRGSRLSVQPVSEAEYGVIVAMKGGDFPRVDARVDRKPAAKKPAPAPAKKAAAPTKKPAAPAKKPAAPAKKAADARARARKPASARAR